jgi:hypothetical protein
VSFYAVFCVLREQKRVSWLFAKIAMTYMQRDTTDFKKLAVTEHIKYLQNHGYIRICTGFFTEHWVYQYANEYDLRDIRAAWGVFWRLFMMGFYAPTYFCIICPIHIFSYLQIMDINHEWLETRDYFHKDDYAPDEQPSLIRHYNIVRKCTINNLQRPFVEFDARPDLMALSGMKHIDPIYVSARMNYERPSGVRLEFKNEFDSVISLELYMQLTTPHIINLLDREEDVKFRLNRSSVNFHGVNVDKYQHLVGNDIVNTTLDCVFHYYRNRKWTYCQSCPDELFYTLPAS